VINFTVSLCLVDAIVIGHTIRATNQFRTRVITHTHTLHIRIKTVHNKHRVHFFLRDDHGLDVFLVHDAGDSLYEHFRGGVVLKTFDARRFVQVARGIGHRASGVDDFWFDRSCVDTSGLCKKL